MTAWAPDACQVPACAASSCLLRCRPPPPQNTGPECRGKGNKRVANAGAHAAATAAPTRLQESFEQQQGLAGGASGVPPLEAEQRVRGDGAAWGRGCQEMSGQGGAGRRAGQARLPAAPPLPCSGCSLVSRPVPAPMRPLFIPRPPAHPAACLPEERPLEARADQLHAGRVEGVQRALEHKLQLHGRGAKAAARLAHVLWRGYGAWESWHEAAFRAAERGKVRLQCSNARWLLPAHCPAAPQIERKACPCTAPAPAASRR